VKQQIFNIIKRLAEGIQNKRLAMRQVLGIFDQARTGFISRADFATTIKSLESGLSLDEARMLMNFFDDKNTGKISVVEFAKAI
jgi:Ca2+-binding EF-hand superfamily protein